MPFPSMILGAAGRDFHNLQTFFRAHPEFRVCAITAAQIPFISARSFPHEIAGPAYSDDIPIVDEAALPEWIRRWGIEFVFLSYSDLSHEEVMHKASLVQSCGATFVLLGPKHTQLRASKPVVSVTASRTGAGKSPLTQALALRLGGQGLHVAVMRHPMPYGDLRRQALQHFETMTDLDRHECTIEEREEYVPYLERGIPVFAGVDYAGLLARAEDDADVILWDGGNNDFSFLVPDLSIVVVDALRPGHELRYYPGETNVRAADVVVINKVSGARREDVTTVRMNVASVNANATVCESDLRVVLEGAMEIRGHRVLVVEDGPTVTHGGMPFGAGFIAAREHGAVPIDPRPFATGTIAGAYATYPHLDRVLPALGYSETQRAELAETIAAAKPDFVLDASPAGIERAIEVHVPVIRVRYRFVQVSGPDLFALVERRVRERLGAE